MYQGLREKLLLLNINPSNVERGKFTSVITLTAPISGDITVMNANVGMFMSPSDVIMEVVDTQHLLLNLNVFESDILKIKEGQNIEFTIPQASKDVYKSIVKTVGKSIENKDRSISVFGLLQPELKEKLLSGMFAEAKIIIATKKGFSVPNEAIIKESDKNFVYLLQNQQSNFVFKKTLVKVGEASEDFTEILPDDHVHQNSKILAKGVFDISN
jgi:cobalt-zinc-cadmium efflux system membrane fusion protein